MVRSVRIVAARAAASLRTPALRTRETRGRVRSLAQTVIRRRNVNIARSGSRMSRTSTGPRIVKYLKLTAHTNSAEAAVNFGAPGARKGI